MDLNKKILVLTDWYYPGFKAGGPIQSCRNLVLALRDSIDFYVFTSNMDLGGKDPYQNVSSDQWVTLSPGEKVYYGKPETYSMGKMRSEIDSIKPGIIYLNSMFSVRYTLIPLLVLRIIKFKGKIILAPRGMLNESALFYKSFKKKFFLKIFRVVGFHKRIDFHATDIKEKVDINKYFPNAQSVIVAPNFANLNTPCRTAIPKIKGAVKVVFISRISPVKNLLFIVELFAKVTFTGKIHLTVAGEIEDKAYWQECLEVINKLPSNIKFNYAGPIEHEKLLVWLQQFHFLFLPTFGENFGHAIFEAFIAGKPVIISDKTPWRNLEQQKLGWDIPLFDEQGFVNALNTALAMNQEQYNDMSAHCASFADAYRNNENTRKLYLELFS